MVRWTRSITAVTTTFRLIQGGDAGVPTARRSGPHISPGWPGIAEAVLLGVLVPPEARLLRGDLRRRRHPKNPPRLRVQAHLREMYL